eukprot:9165375-Pyramimonas_sp.AAC.1
MIRPQDVKLRSENHYTSRAYSYVKGKAVKAGASLEQAKAWAGEAYRAARDVWQKHSKAKAKK